MFTNQLNFCLKFFYPKKKLPPPLFICAWAMPQAKKGLQKVHSVEKTTVLRQSISSYMLSQPTHATLAPHMEPVKVDHWLTLCQLLTSYLWSSTLQIFNTCFGVCMKTYSKAKRLSVLLNKSLWRHLPFTLWHVGCMYSLTCTLYSVQYSMTSIPDRTLSCPPRCTGYWCGWSPAPGRSFGFS